MRICRLGRLGRLEVVCRRELRRGEKTAEDQGVPWRRTRVLGGGCGCGWGDGDEAVVWRGEERRVYFIDQFAWWKVDGRLRAIGEGILFGGRFVGAVVLMLVCEDVRIVWVY
jgi:hypothetical protein